MGNDIDSKRLEELEASITKLTNMVEKISTTRTTADITADEMKSFQKVRDMLITDWGGFCGINDCFQCIIQKCVTSCFQKCIVSCINECSCGPCSIGGVGGGIRRFKDLGE